MKLTGKNFQPWPEFSIDIEKLTVLTGPSNAGKSSVYRALRGIARNELDVAFIRTPKDEPLELILEIDGHVITATRPKKGKVAYTVDGPANKFTSLDGDVPEFVKSLLMGEVTVGKFKVDPIFARQNSRQFLIDSDGVGPTELNTILGAFGGTEKLEAGKREANTRITSKNSEAKTHAEEIRAAEARKATLAELLPHMEALDMSVQNLWKQVASLAEQIQWLSSAQHHRDRAVPLRHIQASLVLPDVSEAQNLYSQNIYARQAVKAQARAQSLESPQQAIEAITVAWPPLVKLWKQICALGDTAELLVNKREFSPKQVSALIDKAETDFTCALDLNASIKYLAHVSILRQRLDDLESQVAGVETELEAARVEAAKGLCSKCGKSLEHICG